MSNTAIALPERGILEIQGPDSQKFLNGQCTADIMSLQPGQAGLGGFCTPKGRLYANFYLLCLSEHRYWLVMPAAQVGPTMSRLQKYAAFFKTTLTDASLHWHCVASLDTDYQNHASELRMPMLIESTDQAVTLQLNDQCQLKWLNPLAEAAYEDQLQILETQADVLPAAAWEEREIAWGLVWVTPECVEEFIPQTIAWDRLGGVSFIKGCYTGQEVVARLHYKGASKKMLRHISGTGATPVTLSPITDDTGKTLGQVARAAGTEEHWTGLAVLHTSSDASHNATLNQATIELKAWINYQPPRGED